MIDDFLRKPKPANPEPKPEVIEENSWFTNSNSPSGIEPVDFSLDLGEDEIEEAPATAPKPPKRTRWFGRLPRGKKILLIVAIIIVLLGGGAAAYVLTQPEDEKAPAATAQNTEKVAAPTTIANTLTGLQVDPSVNKQAVTGVMIENSLDARPQSGLLQAGVVFEAIAEGGITRFLAIFQDTSPDYVGPVRSVRPYYINWAAGFDASIAHVGGSPEALQNIKDWGIKDLDQSFNSKYYDRVTSRYAPHNVYTSLARLRDLQASKGFTTTDFTGFARKKESALATPTAKTITVDISSQLYRSSYTYDAATNSYLRSLGGTSHTDEKSGKQLNPKVVIVPIMDYSIQSDGKHSVYGVIGSGKVYVFQDGGVTEGTWEKKDRSSQMAFSDSTGASIGLNPGQTWITALSASNKLTYAP